MGSDAAVALSDVRNVTADLAVELRRLGAGNAADALEHALAGGGSAPPETLLELRSALVRTRSEWEALSDPTLVARGRAALAAAKRLAIEM